MVNKCLNRILFGWKSSGSSNVEDKEWYFFCKRGRKYRNSIRPNRVITGSGFWKATGIDKQIYSSKGSRDCIGLKKSLVYYQGSAGKGTKTDWMMHEFRLPPGPDKGTNNIVDAKNIAREAVRISTHIYLIHSFSTVLSYHLLPFSWSLVFSCMSSHFNIMQKYLS